MRDDLKLGLAAVVLMAACCGGPVFLSLLASGAVLGALGSVWSGGRLLLAVSGALLAAAAAWLLLRRHAPSGGTACDAPPPPAMEASNARGDPAPTAADHR
jgi:hypothetical protein